MKTKISLLLLAILCNISVFAQSDFDKYFEKKSLRVDFALSGNLKSQSAAIQGLREEPVWGGPVKNLIDKFNYGGYYINVYDKATNKLIYSRGFNTLFEEWRSTEQAKTETQSWTNSASVPFPESTCLCRDHGTRQGRHAIPSVAETRGRSQKYLHRPGKTESQ